MDPNKLIKKVTIEENINEQDLNKSIGLLKNHCSEQQKNSRLSLDDVYTILLLIEKCDAKQYRHLVEYFLDSKDSETVSLCLNILCIKWGRIIDYFEQLINFSLGLGWDEEEDLKVTALDILIIFYDNNKTNLNADVLHKIEQTSMILQSSLKDSNIPPLTKTKINLFLKKYGN